MSTFGSAKLFEAFEKEYTNEAPLLQKMVEASSNVEKDNSNEQCDDDGALSENRRLKEQAQSIQANKLFGHNEGPAVQVVYMNHKFARKYRSRIETFITSLFEDEKRVSEGQAENNLSLAKRDTEIILEKEFSKDDSDPASKQNQKENGKLIGCAQFYCNFILDVSGWLQFENQPTLATSWDVPMYSQVFRTSLPIAESDEQAESASQTSGNRRSTCFNCSGFHALKDCTEEKNQSRINANRKKHSSSRSRNSISLSQNSSLLNEEVKPGQISDELRQALGLQWDEVPVYIYKMRVLGYPPGHLEQVYQPLSLQIFETNEQSENRQEEEELMLDKLIEYPGFNVPLPDDCIDRHRQFNCPAMQSYQQVECLREYLIRKTQTSGKRRFQEHDGADNSLTKRSKKNPPSIEEGEVLEEDLNMSRASSCPSTIGKGVAKRQPETSTPAMSRSLSSMPCSTATPGSGLSLSFNCGTPIAQGAADIIPDVANFSKGILPDIPFENLPNTEGRYDNMRNLLKGMRNVKNKTI